MNNREQCMPVCSAVSDSMTPWTTTHQALLSTELCRQEHWSGVPFPSPGDLPHPGMEPMCPTLAGRFPTTKPPGTTLDKRMPPPQIRSHPDL